MRARREAKELAAAAAEAEKQTEKQYLDAVLREYKPRKGGTAKWKKGSKVLVPHTDQASLGMGGWVAQLLSVLRMKGRHGQPMYRNMLGMKPAWLPPAGHCNSSKQRPPGRRAASSPGPLLPPRAPPCLQYYGAVVMQGQKREDGQWYLLHYEGAQRNLPGCAGEGGVQLAATILAVRWPRLPGLPATDTGMCHPLARPGPRME